MEIIETKAGTKLAVSVEGRLDINSSPKLEQFLKGALSEIEELTLDFQKLEYISSAGLRVILMAQKQMNKQGSMIVCNINEVVMEIFDVTGFSDILTIQ